MRVGRTGQVKMAGPVQTVESYLSEQLLQRACQLGPQEVRAATAFVALMVKMEGQERVAGMATATDSGNGSRQPTALGARTAQSARMVALVAQGVTAGASFYSGRSPLLRRSLAAPAVAEDPQEPAAAEGLAAMVAPVALGLGGAQEARPPGPNGVDGAPGQQGRSGPSGSDGRVVIPGRSPDNVRKVYEQLRAGKSLNQILEGLSAISSPEAAR
jgi:hypothetical protein